MLVYQIGLVAETSAITPSELTRVAAALQKQAVRDFGPIWEVQATVDPFVALEDVPIGYWPVVVKDAINFNALGIHLDKEGQPFALVRYTEGWSLTASHECLEMLADPFGNRVIAGPSVKAGQDRVEYLVEVSDPSEGAAYSYAVNGINVSDFYTPHFFDPVAAPGVRYSFSGKITRPRQVLPGGYLSWHDVVSDHWWQEQYFGAQPAFVDLGVLTPGAGQSLRSMIDSRTKNPELRQSGIAARTASLLAATEANPVDAATRAKASMLRAAIGRLDSHK